MNAITTFEAPFGKLPRRSDRAGELLNQAANVLASTPSPRRGSGGRTYHMTISSLNKTRPISSGGHIPKGSRPEYILRLDQFADRDDLIDWCSTLDPGTGDSTTAVEMKMAMDLVADATIRKDGRVAIAIILELPAELWRPGLRQIMREIVGWFEETGRPTIAAIHSHGDPNRTQVQPHLHLLTTARPFKNGTPMPPGKRGRSGEVGVGKDKYAIFTTSEELRNFRRTVIAPFINKALAAQGCKADWHGGRFADVGIDRVARKRIPTGKWLKLAQSADHGGPKAAQDAASLATTVPDPAKTARYRAMRDEKAAAAEAKLAAKTAQARRFVEPLIHDGYKIQIAKLSDELVEVRRELAEIRGKLVITEPQRLTAINVLNEMAHEAQERGDHIGIMELNKRAQAIVKHEEALDVNGFGAIMQMRRETQSRNSRQIDVQKLKKLGSAIKYIKMVRDDQNKLHIGAREDCNSIEVKLRNEVNKPLAMQATSLGEQRVYDTLCKLIGKAPIREPKRSEFLDTVRSLVTLVEHENRFPMSTEQQIVLSIAPVTANFSAAVASDATFEHPSRGAEFQVTKLEIIENDSTESQALSRAHNQPPREVSINVPGPIEYRDIQVTAEKIARARDIMDKLVVHYEGINDSTNAELWRNSLVHFSGDATRWSQSQIEALTHCYILVLETEGAILAGKLDLIGRDSVVTIDGHGTSEFKSNAATTAAVEPLLREIVHGWSIKKPFEVGKTRGQDNPLKIDWMNKLTLPELSELLKHTESGLDSAGDDTTLQDTKRGLDYLNKRIKSLENLTNQTRDKSNEHRSSSNNMQSKNTFIQY